MNQIIAYLTCFVWGGIFGWGITVINWRITQTDYKIKYESSAMSNKMLLDRVQELERKMNQLEPIG